MGHANNFDFIRWLAASMVIASHEYAVLGRGDAEPLGNLSSGFVTFGTVGVDIFFVVSGCLIAQSMVRSGDVGYFVAARILRIYPGLVVALLVSVLGIGVAATTLPIAHYLAEPLTWSYLYEGLALHRLRWTLPGVFEALPLRGIVNGSLWSLWPEMQMYMAVAALGAIALVARLSRCAVMIVGMVAIAVVSFANHPDPRGLVLEGASLARLAPFFAFGALIGLAPRRPRVLLALLALAIAAAALLRGTALFVAAFDVALALGVLSFAHAPIPRLARFGRHGDWSYGMYVYAFPVQQLVTSWWPGLPPGWHFAIAYPTIAMLGALSWHLVEAPALGLKRVLRMRRSRVVAVAAPP